MKHSLWRSVSFIIFTCGLVAEMSCKKKEEHTEPHVNTATITIASPIAGSAYAFGDTVHIRSTVTAQQEMHGYEVYIRKQIDSLVVFSRQLHLDGTSYDIREEFVNNVSVPLDMELEIVVILDHEGNKTSRKVAFRCTP